MEEKRTRRYLISFGILAALLLALLVWNIRSGSLEMSVREIVQTLLFRSGENAAVIWDIRLPRIVAVLVMVGALTRGLIIGSALMIAAAFVGAMLCMGFVLLISQKVKKMSLLIICGVMIGDICSAVTDFVVTFADDSNIVNLHNWSMGSFSGISWENITIMAPVVLGALLLLVFYAQKRVTDAYQ